MSVAFSARSARRLFVMAGTVALAGSVVGQSIPATHSGEGTVALTPLVVSASRTPQDPKYVASAVTVLPLADLARLQVPTLAEALGTVPGVILVRTGAVGGQASLFIRGAASHQTLFVVDGVRMNDRSAAYFNTLGGASLGGLDRLEVLRGPQSTLYGSNAIGGIILMDTAHGCGPTTGKVSSVFGSDQTWGAGVSASGGTRSLGYSAHLDRYKTDNDRPWNRFEGTSGSARLEATPTDWLLIGATARVSESRSEEPGSLSFPSHALVHHTQHLATAYARADVGESFTSRLTLAQHQRHYLYRESWGPSDLRNRRRILDWQNTYTPNEQWEVVAGTNVETSRYHVGGADLADRLQAGFATATFKPVASVVLNAGLRHDDYGTFSSATTGRGGVTWLVLPELKARATYGTGFIAPGTDDRFGVPAWGQLPSPNLRAEKSRGWDAGVDYTFKTVPATTSVTYFSNRIRDLFEWSYVNFVTYEGQIVNRAKAKTSGVELAQDLTVAKIWRLRASYTYLDARDGVTEARLTRRPRHVIDGSVTVAPTHKLNVGVGTRVVAGRIDTTVRQPSFATWRAFASWEIVPHLTAQARVENALDRAYEEVRGYRSLPRQIFGGLEWTF